jgi:uncharacterized protein (TIGR02271 family)
MTTTIVGLFDHRPDAHAVAQALHTVGLAPDAVSVVVTGVYGGTDADLRALLVTAGAAPSTADVYVAEVARGGTLVIGHADSAAVPTVVDIMQQHHIVDIEHRRKQRAVPTAVQASPAPRRSRPLRRTSTTPTGGPRGRATVDAATPGTHDEIAVPIVEEELRIGTRQVDTGGVRVVTHVEEVPVQEQVTVRTEQVHIERRAVDRVVGDGDIPPLHDGTIEVRGTAEEVVVDKQTRIVEEVVIRKDIEEHTETVSDTVRRTDVQVEDLPGPSRAPSS